MPFHADQPIGILFINKFMKPWKLEKKDSLKYSCHLCGKLFTRGNYLTKHLLKIHKFHWPSGHCRFQYNLNEDGCYRLQTVRYESLELSEAMMSENAESVDDPNIASNNPVQKEQISDFYCNDLSASDSQISNKQVLHSSNPVINGSVVVCLEGGRNLQNINLSDSSVSEEPVLINILEAPEHSMANNTELFTSHSGQSQNVEQLISQPINLFYDDKVNSESTEALGQYEILFSQL